MEASGYSLHLYCDNKGEDWPDGKHTFKQFPEEFDAQSRGPCVRAAQKKGWIFKRDRTHVCPRCSGKVAKVRAGG